MTHRERCAIERVAIGELADPLAIKKLLDAIAQHSFAPVLSPPRVIDRPVADAPPGVVAEGSRRTVASDDLCPVKVVALGRKPCLRPGYFREQVAAHVCSRGPEHAVFLWSPARPQ